ncbi:MAG: hypothetical protein RL477_1471 [Pseudomonadota bacterium]|jgi:hypothetical protein
MFSRVSRTSVLGALSAALILAFAVMVPSGSARAAACKLELLTGQWQHKVDNSRWAFFTNKRVDCRLCRDWSVNGGCNYVPDEDDEQGRKQCTYGNGREVTKIVPAGKVTVTGWEGANGVLAKVIFSDGTVHDVAKTCSIDGARGVLTIPGIGDFQCHYNYQCTKLEREAQ